MLPDPESYDRIYAEYSFRKAMIFRLYPEARIRVSKAGGSWDCGQPTAVYIVLGEDTHDVIYDHELSKLMRAMDKLYKPMVSDALAEHPPDPNSLPMRMKNACIAFAALAANEETWTPEVQALWSKFKNPPKS